MLEIEDLKEKDCDEMSGQFFCKCVNKKIEILYDKKLPFNRVQESIEYLYDIYPQILNDLCKYTVSYCKDFMSEYPDIEYVKGLKDIKQNIEILNHVNLYSIKVQSDNNTIILNMFCGCDWAEEKALQWIIVNDCIKYVGPWYDLELWSPGISDSSCNYCIK